MNRREFLKAVSIAGLTLGTESVLSGCNVLFPNPIKDENAPPTLSGENVIPFADEIPPIKEGEGPAGKLVFSTDPAKKFGSHNLEYHPELIEQGLLSLSNTDGTNLKQYPTSVISRPVWSPDGNTLAVHSYERGMQGEYGMLVFLDTEGMLITRTDTPLSPAEFAWSPDGKSIYYTSRFFLARTLDGTPPDSDMDLMMNPKRPANWITGVYRYDLSTGRYNFPIKGLSSELIHSPSVSPDGTKVAYVRHTNGSSAELTIIDAHGETKTGEPQNIPVFDTETSLLTNASTRIQWTPDGKTLLYMMEHGDMDIQGNVIFSDGNILHVVDVANPGNPVKRILLPGPSYVKMPGFQFSDQTGSHETNANWNTLDNLDLSPDGSKIAFGSPGKITVMDLGGKIQSVLMLPKALTGTPDDIRWLLDGRIGLTHNDCYYVANPTSRKVEQVTFPGNTTTDTELRFSISSG